MDEEQTRLENYTVVIVGGGAAGIAVAARLRRARAEMSIAVIDPSALHAYQPGWTLVGAGVMRLDQTIRREKELIPRDVSLIEGSVIAFQPDDMTIMLEGGRKIAYRRLVVCPGLQLDWDKIEGLRDALGHNGVTSNYDGELAAYTWECVQNVAALAQKGEKPVAIFTQPSMPIKCAGAPQKAAYLSSDYWRKNKVLQNVNVAFCMAGDALFGVGYFVPILQHYIDRYGISLQTKHNLIAVDRENKEAIFQIVGTEETVTRKFDMLHVVPPQSAPDFIKKSPLSNEAGWLAVDPATLCHKVYETVFGLGDVIGTSNAKTAAAARDQAPIVAGNVLASLAGRPLARQYDGYGACPLTVEYGRVVLAEFLYGGKVAPSFPYDQRKPSRFAWWLKTWAFPRLYWFGMLRGLDPVLKHKVKE